MSAEPRRSGRSRAEWTTFSLSVLVVLALLTLIGVESFREDLPPTPAVAMSGPVEPRGDRFHVPVVVTNSGDEAAEAVQIFASLEIDGETIEGNQTVDFLSGGDRAELVFVFDDDPADGDLTIRVAGYTVP